MKHRQLLASFLSLTSIALLAPIASADSLPEVKLVIENQQFNPTRLTIPSGQKVKVVVENKDAAPAEFESYDFNREKVIPGNSQAVVYVGPLEAGSYGFFNDFYQSAKGELTVK